MTGQGSSVTVVSGISVPNHGVGRPIVFLRGAEPPNASTEVIQRLSKAARVFAPWLPGFGASELPSDYSAIDDLAYSQLDLLQRLGLEEVVLVGASFAGWVAAEMAIRSTARISHLVLADAFGLHVGAPTDVPVADVYALDAQTLASRMFADPAFGNWDIGGASDAELLGYACGRETQALMGWGKYMHNPILKRWLHRIDVPTLVIWGASDGIASRSLANEYIARIPNAQLRVVNGAGHFPHIERPQEFAAEVLAFAGRADAA